MTATVLQILRGARALLERPEAWTQGASHRDADGVACNSPDAAARCLSGAMCDTTDGPLPWDEIYVAFGLNSISDWNDSPRRTHAQVLRRLDRAIKRAEKEEA